MGTQRLAAVVLVLLAAIAAGQARLASPATPGERMAAAADRFLALLDDDLRTLASIPLDSRERTDWHYIPRERAGVKFKQLNDAQRKAVHNLLRSALSSRGYLKSTGIMELEGVLREMATAAGHDATFRDAGNYTVAIFGRSGAGQDEHAPWGWRLEGHHISLNFTAVTGELVAVTPAFLGANPANVPSGPRAGLRVLAAEEDLGRELLGTLDGSQRSAAIIEGTAPADIVLSPGRALDIGEPRGLAYASMTPAQQGLLVRLIEEYAENLHHDLAAVQMERIRSKGLETVRFAWAGGDQPGQGSYYRIHGPTFIIEYDNTQDSANHVHTVWHDLEHDFGTDLLKQHYEHEHGGREK